MRLSDMARISLGSLCNDAVRLWLRELGAALRLADHPVVGGGEWSSYSEFALNRAEYAATMRDFFWSGGAS